MDQTNVKDRTLIELMHKTQQLVRKDTFGIQTKYCWDEVIFKFKAVQLIEDETADTDAKICAAFFLNNTLDQKIVNILIPTITNNYIPYYEQAYRGEIPSLTVMNNVNAIQKVEGWWWAVTGDFTFGGIDYHTGDEVYWNSTGFHFYGGAGSGTAISGVRFNSGALVGLVDKTLTHTLGYEPYILQAKLDGNIYLVNTLKVDPASPTTKIIIQVEESLPDGLEITLI